MVWKRAWDMWNWSWNKDRDGKGGHRNKGNHGYSVIFSKGEIKERELHGTTSKRINEKVRDWGKLRGDPTRKWFQKQMGKTRQGSPHWAKRSKGTKKPLSCTSQKHEKSEMIPHILNIKRHQSRERQTMFKPPTRANTTQQQSNPEQRTFLPLQGSQHSPLSKLKWL